MLKNILKLDGAQKLSKSEQKSINGGGGLCSESECLPGYFKSCVGRIFFGCFN